VLVGTPRRDALDGRGGDDVIRARAGRDTVQGGRGDDRIFVRDGQPDVVRCGPGSDVVVADGRDRLAADCESVRR
jgi:Ca2+-binding RTX toxin-like protein